MKTRRDVRPKKLLDSIIAHNEGNWNPISASERDIVFKANIINDFISRHNVETIRKSISLCSWSMGIEILKFMGEYHDDDEKAYDIVSMAGSYDNDMRTGILDDVYQYCIDNDTPPQWALPSMINVETKNDKHTFIINPKGLKI
jgi:hypothetical protein